MAVAQDASIIGSDVAQGASQGGPIGAAAGAIKGVITAAINELAQHSLRLKDAKNENASIPPVVFAFDSDIAAIQAAYNSGTDDAATCIRACQVVYESIKANMQNAITTQGGAFMPGTAWNETVGVSGKCNKQCTAGCCVFYGNLGPVLSMMIYAMGGQGYFWGPNDPRYKANAGGGATIQVPEVFASKYGGQDRPGYTVIITPPPPVHQVATTLKNTISQLLGQGTPESSAGDFVSKLAGSSGAPTIPLAGGSTNTLLIVGVMFLFFALLLVVKK
jgi:hypothetical protein